MNSVFTKKNQVTDCTGELQGKDIPTLIRELTNSDSYIRVEARDALSCIGAPAVPELVKTFANADMQMRWQIIKIFESIHDPSTVPILIKQLMVDNAEIRWAASNALINLRRAGVPALLEALVHDFDSMWLRQSAHHILRVLRDNGRLTPAEQKVYKALEDIEPAVSVPWAARKALDEPSKNNLLPQ